MRYLFVLWLFLITPLVWAEASIGEKKCADGIGARVISLQGKLYYGSGSSSSYGWREGQLDDSICEGSRVKIGPDSRAVLRLTNGITVKLAPNTIVALKEVSEGEATWLSLVQGFLHTISRTPKRLTIETPIANAGPEGTEFALSADANEAKIWVYEGGVKFYNPHGDINLKAGQSAQAQAEQAPQARIDLHPQDAVNWALYYPPLLPVAAVNKASDSRIQQAVQAYRHGRGDTALAQLNVLPPALHSADFFKNRAAILLILGQDQAALRDIDTLLTLAPNDADALALKSVRALTQNRKDEALALANQAIAAHPNSANAYSALSYAEQGRFDLDKARVAAGEAAKLAPNDAMVWARKAELELSQGATEESRRAVEQAMALDPNLERTQTIMGFDYLLRTDTENASKAFNQAVRLDSTSPLARLGLGLTKIRMGDLEEGRQDLETAAMLDPNNSLIRSYLGKAYYEERRGEMADEQFRLAKERDPKDPTPFFYDAIHKQTTNRPGEALQDMQKAIELNDNRAVYRSKFQLDKDTAARQVGLGRIFTNLGFDDPANREAIKSLAIDPGNYSAHRLLSDSYAAKPRHEIARASEHLQSQLLQPLNYNPIQPSLAYTDLNIIRGVGPNDMAFNEYNRLFERNGIRLTTTGIAGSNSTYGDEAALSGIWDKFSFSLGQLHYQTDGFRKNNDLKHNLYNVFAQYEITPEFNVQAEYRHRETEHGDLEIAGEPILAQDENGAFENFFSTYRRRVDQDTYRYGMRLSPAQHSDILVSLIHANRTESIKQEHFNFQDNSIFTTNNNLKTKSYDLETQYIYKNDVINTIAGLGLYHTNNKKTIKSTSRNSVCISTPQQCINDYDTTQYFGYLYSNFKILNNLTITTGLSYDNFSSNDPGAGTKVSELNPKFGILWQVNQYISFRAAAFKSVKSAIIDSQILQPTQIAGFNQFFDDDNGSTAWQYSVGIDTHFLKNVYIGVEASKRDLKIPRLNTFVKPNEELYRAYFNWPLTNNITINSEFRFENYRGFDPGLLDFVETAYIPLELRFFSPFGFFASIKGTYVNQKAYPDTNFDKKFYSDFYLLDAAIGYRFPKQYGLISFEAKNLFDKQFKYRDRQFQMNEIRSSDLVPERMLFARITLNF